MIPFVFEHRGFVEDNIMVHIRYLKKKQQQVLKKKAKDILSEELEIMKKSDLIITLSNIMKKELVKRISNSKKIKIIPNGADTLLIHPVPPNIFLKENLKLKDSKVLGFIGSINKYEGIEILILSIPYILREINNLNLLLIGRGDKNYVRKLKKLSIQLKIMKNIKFIDQVPHHIIKDYYSIIDIIVLPRLNLPVCRKVTPLKPLEAMAFQKLVIASNLPALKQVIIPGNTGDLFIPEDPEDLAKKIIYYFKNPKKKKEIEKSARSYVEENYSWNKIIPKYKKFYSSLFKNKF